LGFDAYQEWFVRFGQSPELPLLNQKILIVIDGKGDLDATLKSLYRQNHINWIALIRERLTDLLYHDDERVQSVTKSQWLPVLQQQFINCDLVSVISAGDYLADNALTIGLHAFADLAVQIVYSDTDMPDSKNGRIPWFKSDFDIDLFLHTNALQDLFMVRARYLEQLDADELSEPSGWCADVISILGEPNHEKIKHLPWVLSHRATVKTIKAQSTHTIKWLAKHSSQQVQLYQNKTDNTVTRIIWNMPENAPRVTLIIPTRDHHELLRQCLTSLKKTNYPNLNYIIVDNDSRDDETFAYFDELKSEGMQILKHSGTFNFSAMNNRAVELASSELIALINNDIVVLNPNWLDEMVRELLRPNVGIVGAKLLWENDFVQHAGVLLGQHGLAGHIGNHWHTDDAGYFGMNQRVRGVSAVTAACLLCRKEAYLAVGGLNENDLPVNFNDVDFCLRIGKTGKRILWTPHAYLRHLESASRGKDLLPSQQARFEREKNYIRQHWASILVNDPFYNANLNLDRYSHAGLAIPSRHSARF
jgi:GT2 family glycosyltransferase